MLTIRSSRSGVYCVTEAEWNAPLLAPCSMDLSCYCKLTTHRIGGARLIGIDVTKSTNERVLTSDVTAGISVKLSKRPIGGVGASENRISSIPGYGDESRSVNTTQTHGRQDSQALQQSCTKGEWLLSYLCYWLRSSQLQKRWRQIGLQSW